MPVKRWWRLLHKTVLVFIVGLGAMLAAEFAP